MIVRLALLWPDWIPAPRRIELIRREFRYQVAARTELMMRELWTMTKDRLL